MDRFLEVVLSESSNADQVARQDQEQKRVKKRARKYDEAFLEYGFTSVEVENEERPQCVLCQVVLAAESMKPNKLRRHLETRHKEHVGKPIAFFHGHKNELCLQNVHRRKNMSVVEQMQRASFEVSYRVAKFVTPHTIAENLILPAAVDMARIMCGDSEANKLRNVPLSPSVVRERIRAIASDLEDTLVERLRCTDAFSYQVDVSSEGCGTSSLLAYVRYVWKARIAEDFLFCRPALISDSPEEVFRAFQTFSEEKRIPWTNLVGFSTDGASSEADEKCSLRDFVKGAAPEAVWTHCLIHPERLMTSSFSPELSEVMRSVVLAVNLVKKHSFGSDLFSELCQELDPDCEFLLHYTEQGWLSKGKFLQRFFDLRHRVAIHLQQAGQRGAVEFLSDAGQACLLAYASDILVKLNEVTATLQARNTDVLVLNDVIDGFVKKMRFWRSCLISRKFEVFQTLASVILEESSVEERVCSVILDHLSKMEECFQAYFPDLCLSRLDWLRNPFQCRPEDIDLPVTEVEQLIEISTNRSMMASFSQSSLIDFWLNTGSRYRELTSRAVRWLLPFATSNLCKAGFNTLMATKVHSCSAVDPSAQLRCVLSPLAPNYYRLCSEVNQNSCGSSLQSLFIPKSETT